MNVWQKFKGWIAKKMNFTVETSPAMKEESFLEWLGVKRKNKDVMAEVTYFTCLKMMSETLAKIPWKYYQKTEKGIIEPELSDVAKLLKNSFLECRGNEPKSLRKCVCICQVEVQKKKIRRRIQSHGLVDYAVELRADCSG